MDLLPEDWTLLLRHLDTALDLPEPERDGWVKQIELAPRLKTLLREMLADRRAIETADFLGAGAHAALLQAGTRLGPWRLLRELGQGGMARVWLAEREDGAHGRRVALKLPHRVLAGGAIAERFLRERAILSMLQHPHIAQVLDAGTAGDQPWLALEFVDGCPITEYADRLGLGPRARLSLFLPVLLAVAHAHGQLVIHRDIKPANVMVDGAGHVKLLDFGVAKLLDTEGEARATSLTQRGGRAMTPQYASPEQVAGRPLGVSSDVYSLGVLLYELLTGHLPYHLKRDTAAALEEAILGAQVKRPSQAAAGRPTVARALRGDVDTIVMKALATEPAQRYGSAAALAEDIQRCMSSLPIAARPAKLGYRLAKLWQRRRWPLLVTGAAALLLVAGVGSTWWQSRLARMEAARAGAVQRLLLDIFKVNAKRENDPLKARAASARELLDIGSERIAHTLDDQPAVRLTLLNTMAELYVDLGLDEKSAELERQALAISEREYGAGSPEHLQQLARLADALQYGPAVAERSKVVGEALALVARGPDRATPERVRVWVQAAELYRSDRVADAETFGERALRDAQALKDDRLLWLAFGGLGTTALQRGDFAGAEARLLASVQHGRLAALEGVDLLVVRVQLAEAQSLNLHLDEAEATLRSALADSLHANGPGHMDTLQTRLRLARALSGAGRLREALVQHEALQLELDQRSTPDDFTLPHHARAYGHTLFELGRLDEAEAVFQRGIEVRERTRPNTIAAADLREQLAHVLVQQGRLAAARAEMQAGAAMRRAAGGHTSASIATDFAVSRALGDKAAATAALARGRAAEPGAPIASLVELTAAQNRARQYLDDGQIDWALAELRATRTLLDERSLSGHLPLVEGSLFTLCARAAGLRGATTQAAALFENARRAYVAELGPAAPLMQEWAQLRSAIGPPRADAAAVDCH